MRGINPSERRDTRAIHAIISSSLSRACTVEEVQTATAKDPTPQALQKCLIYRIWDNPQFSPYYPHRSELLSSDGVVLRNNRIVLPAPLQRRILELAHQGHHGVAKTKSRLRTKARWPGMSNQADNFVCQCQSCLLPTPTPSQPAAPLKSTSLPKVAWFLVGLDFVGPFPTG